MNKVLILGLVALVGCGGKMTVVDPPDETSGAPGGDADETITIECTETTPENFVCAIPGDQVLNLVLQGQRGEQGSQGLAGTQGVQGEKGDTGDAGLPGEQGSQGLQGPQGEAGPQGLPGNDAPACAYLTIDRLEYQGQCLYLGNDLWAEHEGGKVDIYNNAQCDHGPSPKKSHCDNLCNGQSCWVGTNKIEVFKDGHDWKVYKLNVSPECSQDNSN